MWRRHGMELLHQQIQDLLSIRECLERHEKRLNEL